ncbi:MAG TPA: SEC-C metal-binding domain-containing protein [Beijerinckiaceae bacterium]|jgi:tetratricopeptide (TPR) repeat protein
MAKPGRNDPCHCGSGAKYKKCCLPKDEATEREGLAEAQRRREEPPAGRRLEVQKLKAAMAAKLADAEDLEDDDTLMDESNAVIDLIRTGKLDEAEAAAHALLARHPEVHDGWDRLGMVHEARGENAQAVDCYRRVIAFLDKNPDYSEPAFRASFVERIARLSPPSAT